MTEQRVALVTGGMGGLGETICVKLAERWASRWWSTYSPGNTRRTGMAAGHEEQGLRQFLRVPCDVTDFDSCAQAVSQVRRSVGESTSWSTTPASRAT